MDKTPLRPTVKVDKIALSAPAHEIAALNGARPWAFTFQLLFAWAVTAGIVA